MDKDAELVRYKEFADRVRPMVVETVSFLHKELKDGKKVLVEGANAAMLDIDFGNARGCLLMLNQCTNAEKVAPE